MRCLVFVFTVVCYGIFSLCAYAATSSQSNPAQAGQAQTRAAHADQAAYARVVLTAPVLHTDPLRLELMPDEAQCRKSYGQNWQERCRIAPGSHGALVKGLRLKPEIAGTWRWEGQTTLVFQPDAAWPLATRLTLDLAGLSLPSRIRLSNPALSLTTKPLAALILPGQLWIDPSPQGERAVSFDIQFNSPPNQQAIRDSLEIKGSSPTLKMGRPELVWSADGARCLLKLTIQKLPPKTATLSVTLTGIQRLHKTDTGWQLPAKQIAGQSLELSGTADLFQLVQVDVQTVRNSTLALEHQLEIKTSLRVRPSELLRALTLIQLPRVNQAEAARPYAWDLAPAVSPDDLNAGELLHPQSLQADDEALSVLRFRVSAAADSYIFASLPAGFGPSPSLTLARPWQQVLRVAPPQSELRFLQSGQVLTPNGAGKIDLVASNLTKVQWRAARVLDPYLGYLAGRTQTIATPYVDPDEIAEIREGELDLAPTAQGQPQFASLDVAKLLPDGRGLMALTLTGFKDKEQVWSAQRFVLVTDLGLLVKTASDGSSDVFVCSLSGQGPIADATVSILGLNGRPVASARTDAQGLARLPSTSGLIREKQPVAIVAEWSPKQGTKPENNKETNQKTETQHKGATKQEQPLVRDMAWLPLRDAGLVVDYSRYATQGQTEAGSSNDGINAYVFAERGIFRPGESLHMGCVIRRGDWQALPAALPLTATLTDPAGRTVMERAFTVGPDGLAEFTWLSSEASTSGRYSLDISAPTPGNAWQRTVLGSGAVRLEEFQPDTLGMSLTLDPQATQGWIDSSKNSHLTTQVRLKNLYGMPAADRRVRARLTSSPVPLHVPGYDEYIFQSARTRGDTLERDLPEVRTDTQGQALIPIDIDPMPGSARLYSLLVEGFEPGGGRAVTERVTFLAAPYARVLGYALRDGATNPEFIPQNAHASVQFLTLNAALEPVHPGPLHITLAQRRYTSSLITDANGRFRYDETALDHELAQATIVPAADGSLRWTLPTTQAGDYVARVHDTHKSVSVDVPFTIAGSDDLRGMADNSLPPARARIRLDKSDYSPGDTVQAFMSVPYDGIGLLTLERDRVVAQKWFSAKAGSSVHTLSIPPDFEGRGYVNVSFIRAQQAPEIFMQPHSYALAPLTVNIARRDMGLRLNAPSHIKPGETLEALVTAAESGRAIVFAVDEGVLQLTRFATPDPLSHLLLDRALGVQTRQMFDLLMPDHSHLQKIISAFGGDAARPGGRFHNPFKRKSEPPLAWWSSLIEVGPEGTRVSIPVPDYYNGRVRIMAVGSTASQAVRAGNADTGVTVRGPLVLTPQVPVMAAPGDTLHASLGIASNLEHKSAVFALTLEHDPALRLVQAPPATITLAGGEETVVPFVMQATDMPGNATIRFRVTGPLDPAASHVSAEPGASVGSPSPSVLPSTVQREASLSIRPPLSAQSSLRVGKTTGSTTLSAPRALYPYKASGSASVATVPLPALRALVRYLDNYPFGCVEQLISRAFPVATLSRMPELLALGRAPDKRGQLDTELRMLTEQALQAIRGALLRGRGVAPWTDAYEPDPLLTAYAADYLLSLHEAGLAAPDTLLTEVCDALEASLDRDPESLVDGRTMAYGIWVLTREGRITTRSIERLTSLLDERAPNWRTDITGTLVAGSLAIMRQTDAAHALLSAYLPPAATFETRRGLDPLAADSLRVAVLARHFPDSLSNLEGGEAELLAERLLAALKSGYTSFSAAQGIRALAVLPGGQNDLGDQLSLRCVAMQPGFDATDPEVAQAQHIHGMLSLAVPGCASYALDTKTSQLPLYWEVSDYGFSRTVPKQAVSEGLEITRTYLDGDGQPLRSVALGQTVRVKLDLRSSGGPVRDVVAIDLLPGGFEMVLDPLTAPAAGPAGGTWRTDRREDRMLIFTDLDGLSSGSYLIRAVNRGSYALPPARIEAMYDSTLFGQTAGGEMIEIQ